MSLIRRDRRWGLDPFQEVSRLESEMRNLFSNVFGDRDLSLQERIFAPLVDIRELDDKFTIEGKGGLNKAISEARLEHIEIKEIDYQSEEKLVNVLILLKAI